MNHRYAQVISFAVFGFLIVASAAAQTTDGKSLNEVNKELSNPISSIWALQLQENTYWLNKPKRNVVNLQFQPVLPLALTHDWNLITRPVYQVMNSTPYVNKSGKLHRVTGLGDTISQRLSHQVQSSPTLGYWGPDPASSSPPLATRAWVKTSGR